MKQYQPSPQQLFPTQSTSVEGRRSMWWWGEEFKGKERNTQNNQHIRARFCSDGGLYLSEGKAVAWILCWCECAGSGLFACGWHLCLPDEFLFGQVKVLLELPVQHGQSCSLREPVFLLPSHLILYLPLAFLILFICSSDIVLLSDPVCLLSSIQGSHWSLSCPRCTAILYTEEECSI